MRRAMERLIDIGISDTGRQKTAELLRSSVFSGIDGGARFSVEAYVEMELLSLEKMRSWWCV